MINHYDFPISFWSDGNSGRHAHKKIFNTKNTQTHTHTSISSITSCMCLSIPRGFLELSNRIWHTWWESLPVLLPSPLKSTCEKRHLNRCLSASGPYCATSCMTKTRMKVVKIISTAILLHYIAHTAHVLVVTLAISCHVTIQHMQPLQHEVQ